MTKSGSLNGGTLAAVAVSTGLLVGLRSIVFVELPRLQTLIGVDTLPREGLGVRWTSRALWPSDFQLAGLERLMEVVAVLVLAAALVGTLNAVILLAESAANRGRELAVRSAVGATPRVLASGMFRELRTLVLTGLTLGTLLGIAGGGLARLLWPGPLVSVRPSAAWDLLIGLGMMVVVLAVAHVVTGIRAAQGPRAAAALRAGARVGADPMAVFVRKALGAGHTAVAGTLLVAALTLTLTFEEPGAQDPRGAATVTTYTVSSPGPARWDEVLANIREIPGIEAESLAAPGALIGLGIREIAIAECGRCSRGGMPAPLWTASADHHAVGPRFFELAGIDIVAGRDFGPADLVGSERVVLVNQTFARTSFERGEPIGKKVRIGSDFANWYTVIGVVEDARVVTLGADDSPREAVYMSALQQRPRSATVLVRGRDEAVAQVQDSLARAGYSPGPAQTVSEHRADAGATLLWTQRTARLVSLLALALAMYGVYATALQTTRRQVGELAVRRALGADARRIAAYVLLGRLRVACWGLAGFAFFGTLMVALLQNAAGLPPAGFTTYGAIAVFLVVVTFVASGRALREALAVEPAAALV